MTTPNVPDGSIIITPTEVYNEVKSLTEVVRQLVARDEAERDRQRRADESEKDRRRRSDEWQGSMEKRVSALEQRVWVAAGFSAGVGSVVGVILPKLFN